MLTKSPDSKIVFFIHTVTSEVLGHPPRKHNEGEQPKKESERILMLFGKKTV